MKNSLLATTIALMAAGAVLPELPPEAPNIFADPGPGPSDPVTSPSDLGPSNPKVIPYRPERVGLVRTENKQTRWVNLIRPVGASDTCTRTTFQAATGEQWVSSEGPNFIKNNDGTWTEYRTVPVAANKVYTNRAYVTTPDLPGGGSTGNIQGYRQYVTTPNLGGGSTGNRRGFYRARWGSRRR